MISGKPVTLPTSRTGTALSASSFAVPPVDTISMLRLRSSRASSSTPDLSETESSARRTGSSIRVGLGLAGQAELLQLLAQRTAIDPQDDGSATLVAFGIVQDHTEEGFLHLAQHEVIEVRRAVAVQAGEVFAQRALSVIAQRQLP